MRWASSGASPPTTSTGSPTTACSRSTTCGSANVAVPARAAPRRSTGGRPPTSPSAFLPGTTSSRDTCSRKPPTGQRGAASRSGPPSKSAARRAGTVIAAEAKQDLGRRAGVDTRRRRLFAELRARGFEPETLADSVTVLHNCPFHQLAQQHTELICGMNLCLLDTILDELDGTELRAALEPEDGYCCVRFHPERPVTSRRSPE